MYKRGLLVFGVALAVMAGASVAGEGPRTVAECLPQGLGQWVKDLEADTALDQLPGWVAEEFRGGTPGPSAMLAILGEKVNVVPAELPMLVVSGDHLVAVSNVFVADEAEGRRAIGVGEKVFPGDEILEGLILNLAPESAARGTSAVVEDGESTVTLAGGEGLLVPRRPCLRSCSITCPDGERSCCWDCGVGKCCACCSCTAGTTCPGGGMGGTSCTTSCVDSS
jgi:hypothetical protein